MDNVNEKQIELKNKKLIILARGVLDNPVDTPQLVKKAKSDLKKIISSTRNEFYADLHIQALGLYETLVTSKTKFLRIVSDLKKLSENQHTKEA